MYLLRMPRWARMEAGQIKGHQFSIVASPINISRTVPSSLYVTQRFPSMIAKNQVFSTNFLVETRKQALQEGIRSKKQTKVKIIVLIRGQSVSNAKSSCYTIFSWFKKVDGR